MLTTEGLIERIKLLIEQHDLNASSFAALIGVQRSSISHILSGRNKPSLEFLVKIEAAFNEVSFEWLLKGGENVAHISSTPPTLSQKSSGNLPVAEAQPITSSTVSKDLPVKIVHYYADGSFESFFKR